MKTQEIDLLQGLVSIIKQYDGSFTQEDISLLRGINNIINSTSVNNWAKGQFDESQVNRDEQGRFAEKDTKIRENVSETIEEVEKSNVIEPLSSSEITTLYIAAQGEDNKAISKELSYSRHTIKMQIGNILRKLNAKNRTDAVIRAIESGILDLYKIEVKIDQDKRRGNELAKANSELSPHEKEILCYAAAGYTRDKIAEKTGKSIFMVKHYQQKFLDKLEVNDATAAAVLALQHKIITLDDIAEIRE